MMCLYLEALMTLAFRYTMTINMVKSENKTLSPATEITTIPIDDPNFGFRTCSGAESAGVL